MSLLHSLYRSNSLVSTLASIAIHLAVGGLVYLSIAKYFNFDVPSDEQPPVLAVSFHQPASNGLLASTVTTLEATIVPPRDEIPEAAESQLELPVELPSDEEQSDITYQQVRPWMPSQLRVRPAVEPVAKQDIATEISATAVEVISQKDTQQCPPPAYPPISKRKGEQGTVTLLVSIRADGQVSAVTLSKSSGHQNLDTAALAAVRTWKYIPATTDGQPRASQVLQSLVFKIEKT
jgi:protein TonB